MRSASCYAGEHVHAHEFDGYAQHLTNEDQDCRPKSRKNSHRDPARADERRQRPQGLRRERGPREAMMVPNAVYSAEFIKERGETHGVRHAGAGRQVGGGCAR